MWQLNNQTPYAVERSGIRDRQGREVWQVVVKASYSFDPAGTVRIADDQPPINLSCVYRSEPGNSSLLYESDFSLEKQRTDIVVNGTAWAPQGRHTTEMFVGFAVGDLSKKLNVIGPRYWRQGRFMLTPSNPEPFLQLPIIWENAYGGEDGVDKETGFPIAYEANPVGKGFHECSSRAINQPLPNINYPNQSLTSPTGHMLPAGMSPIPKNWQPRSGYGGSYDDDWQQNQSPLLPLDLSPLFFQSAPADQQYPGFLQGGEQVRLIHLTQEGDVTFVLPEPSFEFSTRFDGMPIRRHEAKITTLIIEPDLYRFSLVFQSDLECQGDEDELLDTRITEVIRR